MFAVRIGQHGDDREVVLAERAQRLGQLVTEGRVVELDEVRVRGRVQADVPAACGQPAQLVGGQQWQLGGAAGGVPLVPAAELLADDEHERPGSPRSWSSGAAFSSRSA